METRIKVAGVALNVAYLPFKLLHPSFSFSFCIFLSLQCLFPFFPVSVCPLRREEGRGVSRGGPPEHTPLECRATVITGLHFSLCSGRLIHTHHAPQLRSFHLRLRPWQTHKHKCVRKHNAWCEERLMDMGWGRGRGDVHEHFEIGVYPKCLAFILCIWRLKCLKGWDTQKITVICSPSPMFLPYDFFCEKRKREDCVIHALLLTFTIKWELQKGHKITITVP